MHTDVGNHTVGAKVNGRIVPLHHKLRSGDIVEIITSKSSRGPVARLARHRRHAARQAEGAPVLPPRAARGQRALGPRPAAGDAAPRGAAGGEDPRLARCSRRSCKEVGFSKPDDLYVAIGSGRVAVKTIANKVMQRAGHDEGGHAAARDAAAASPRRAAPRSRRRLSGEFGIAVEGMSDIMVRMAKCCKPIPGDEIVGYISLGKGITIHRADCKNARALMKNPERFTRVGLAGPRRHGLPGGGPGRGARPQPPARGPRAHALGLGRQHHRAAAMQTLPDGVVRDRFTLEVGDVRQLDNILANIRAIDTVYDAYRVDRG